MFPFLGSLLTGGLGLLGSIFSSNSAEENNQRNIAMQMQTNQLNAQEAEKNRQFQAQQAEIGRTYQTSMSNTAFQRASQDMQKAGLNPAMMFGSAGAASTPSSPQPGGSQATMQSPRTENTGRAFEQLGEIASRTVNSAIQAKTFEKMTDEIALLRAQESRTRAEEVYTAQKRQTEVQETGRREAEKRKSQADVAPHEVREREAEAVKKIPPWLFDLLNESGYLGGKTSNTIKPIADIISSAMDVKRMRPSRETREKSHTDTAGNRWDSFEEIWRNRAH